MTEKPKLLYVDDERANLVAFRALFSDTYQVLIAENAADAYLLLQENEIPLIITDQRMPGMTGTELLEKVASDFPECVRMILTGYADIEAVIEAVNRSRIYYYFKKPWNEAEVRLTLGNALESSMTRRQLIESEQRFRNTFEQAGLGIAHLDLQGQIIRANARLQDFLGLAEAELVGRQLTTWFAGVGANELAALVSGRSATLELETSVPTHRGERWSCITLSSSLDRRGEINYLIALVNDLTERKLLEEKLLHSQKMDCVGQIAGGVAHDFNNILTAILGFTFMLQQKMKEGDPQQDILNQIMAAAERAAQLTRSLLVFSRKQTMTLKPVNLNELVSDHVKFLARVIGELVHLQTDLCSDLLAVSADSGQIEQVLMNLATNARDAMPGGGLLSIKTTRLMMDEDFIRLHGYGTPGEYAVIAVTDTGCGMDNSISNRIFEPFFTTKEVGKGTGLGLSIVYGIIKQHNGFITVYSEPGTGTTFKIYLPLIILEETAAPRILPSLPKGGAETILVAEDDPLVRQLVEMVLGELGYNVILAENGQEVVDTFTVVGEKIDLVLLDVMMPKLTGKQACAEIRRIKPDVKVLFMSGYNMDMILDKGLFVEGAEFLTKPVQSVELAGKIRELLDRK
jgi:two-component system NtrC family sensor kinase